MNEPDIKVSLAGILWKNPITTASGTFSVRDSSNYYNLSEIGALTTKGVSLETWKGNDTPRIAETYGGMLNCVGLQNPGLNYFIKNELPLLKKYNVPIIVNVAGTTIEEYCSIAEKLNQTDIHMIEINISCPNIKQGGLAFGTDAKMAELLTKEIRKRTQKPLFVKLSPNVTDITEIAKAVEAGGADGISLINTLLGMSIDLQKRRPVLANVSGGLSGPAIKPVAVRMVYQVSRAVKLPLIGMGGIITGEDAAEFIMAGASAVAVGTAALIDPEAPIRIRDELVAFMKREGYETLGELREALTIR